MFLSRWSVQRPIAMTALIIVLVMIGISLYPRISIDLLPNMEIPTVLVRCEYQGASPTEIEVEIVKRIEDAVSSLDGIKHITSMSIEDEARIQLEFNMGTDVDVAATDIREALNRIREDLPDGANEPTIRKIDTNATTVAQVFLVGDRTQDDLYDYADDVIADRFSSVPGVGEVRVYGANEMQIHVLLDREKLTAMNLSINDVVAKLEQNNVREPLGRIQFDKGEKNVTFDGDFKDFEQIRALEVGKFKNKRVYLRDVAEVKFMSREVRSKAYVNGQPAARFRIVKKGEANAIEVINGIRQRFDAMVKNGELPTGMELVWFTDSGAFIQASVDDAWSSIVTGIILTAVLLFLFLHEPKSTFIVMISMPISVVVTFAVMAYFNYSFNIMTLLSLGCSVGVLVTNSIVVIENIFKHLDRGEPIKTAAERGTGEVIAAVSASALTNVVVFVPVMMMTTRIGSMMVPFAGVMVGATLVSLFISFTLTPILACVLLKRKKKRGSAPEKRSWLQTMFLPWDMGYDWLCRKFDRSIEWTARHPKSLMLTVLALAAGVSFWIVPQVGLSFLPFCDQGEIRIKFEFPTNYNLDTTDRLIREAADHLKKFDFIRGMSISVGDSDGGSGQVSSAVYMGQITLRTTDKFEREETIYDLQAQLRKELSYLDNCRITLSIPATFGGSGAEIRCVMNGTDLDVLENAEMQVMEKLPAMGLTRDLDSSRRERKPNINITPRRTVLQNLGMSANELYEYLLGSLDGIEVGDYRDGARTFDIRVKNQKEYGEAQLRQAAPAVKDNNPLGAEALAEITEDARPVVVNRYDKVRTMWLYANTAPGAALGTVSEAIGKLAQESLPPGYGVRMSGNVELMNETAREFMQVIVLATILTYLLIAAIMESWTRPFLIMFTVPLGFLGMYATLWAAGMSMSMMGLLGGVMMIGIVVNNAILIMDECAALVKSGVTTHKAMLLATQSKFRPIVMTSIASVAGMLPMAFGTGLGSELRSSCGMGVVGGLTIASLLTLYVIPALYFIFVHDTAKPRRRWFHRLLLRLSGRGKRCKA
ncbi:efflux RND transporter permease subunit [Victivallis vadensis]|uniref:Efflux RND transporter permease subunit n=1 Tax=Victivallis vadensis TaxID=172901 RepID=A0A848AXL2_9BACT|nr:efflux RND transporter permease subunit [Victivallis vadensis]NMD85672.1 efflux RND transporter permease subunit [Victivallis vadensis]